MLGVAQVWCNTPREIAQRWNQSRERNVTLPAPITSPSSKNPTSEYQALDIEELDDDTTIASEAANNTVSASASASASASTTTTTTTAADDDGTTVAETSTTPLDSFNDTLYV
jgi:hypothetical protein